jgi:hypothetical protein
MKASEGLYKRSVKRYNYVVFCDDDLPGSKYTSIVEEQRAREALERTGKTQYIYKLHKIVEAVPVETPVEIRVTEVE